MFQAPSQRLSPILNERDGGKDPVLEQKARRMHEVGYPSDRVGEKNKARSKGGGRRGEASACRLISRQGVGIRPYTAYADVEIQHDGTMPLYVGVVDIGGGQHTSFAMMAAEELGVNSDDVTVMYGDTQNTRYGPSCHVSRATPELGPAVLQAAAEARRRLFQLAAPLLGAMSGVFGPKTARSTSNRSPPCRSP